MDLLSARLHVTRRLRDFMMSCVASLIGTEVDVFEVPVLPVSERGHQASCMWLVACVNVSCIKFVACVVVTANMQTRIVDFS